MWRPPSVVRLVPLLGSYVLWRQATVGLDLYPTCSSSTILTSGVKPWLVLLNVRREIGIFILNWFHVLMSCSCSPNIQVEIVSVYKQADGHRIGHATYHMPSFNRRCIVIERGSIFLTASVCSYERFGSIALLSYRICPFFSGDLEISRRRVSFQKRATPNKHTNTPTRQHHIPPEPTNPNQQTSNNLSIHDHKPQSQP